MDYNWVVVRTNIAGPMLASMRLMDEYTAKREAQALQVKENETYRGRKELEWEYKAVRLDM